MPRTAEELQARLEEAEELLGAIRSGEVDALVVAGPLGDQVFTLSGAEHPYRVMVEAMSEGAVILTADRTIFYSNRGFAAMVEAPLEEVIGSNMGRFVLEEDMPRFDTLTRQTDEGFNRGEISLTARNGSVVPVQLSISSFDTGTARSACVVVTDLTEHKRHQTLVSAVSAEAVERTKRTEAEAGRRRIASILEGSTDSYFSMDREWRITDVNQRAAANFGTTRDALLGTVFWNVSPPGRFPELDEQYHRAMTQRVPLHSEEPSAAAQGRWFERHIYPTEHGLAVYFRDITERKQAEDKLREVNESLAMLLESIQKYVSQHKRAETELRRREALLAEGERISHTGSWVWNVATGEMLWSLEHFRICGVDPATFILTVETARQMIHPEDSLSANQAFDEAVSGRTDFDQDFRIVRPDGAIRYVRSLGHPVCDDTGELTEYIGTIADITERKEQERARRELPRRLGVAQEDERRRIALEMHDQFGQHLSALVLKLSTLRRERGRRISLDGQLGSLEKIARQLDTDLDLIVSRLRPPALDDLGLVAALKNYAKRWSEHFDIHTELHASGTEPSRLTDEIDTGLYRITQEALNNVAKHAQAKSVAILLDERPGRVSLIVEDDGIGFDEEPVGTRQRFGIVGMRERAALIGGTLDIESRPGKGTTVVARIPVPSSPARKPV